MLSFESWPAQEVSKYPGPSGEEGAAWRQFPLRACCQAQYFGVAHVSLDPPGLGFRFRV